MAYHMLVVGGEATKPIFDKYLGTASLIDVYWESAGRSLGQNITSSILERADSEVGFVLEGDDLVVFRWELVELEKYWRTADLDVAVPESFFGDISEIVEAVDQAIANNLKLMIG